MSDTLKVQLISAANTFITAFILTLGASLSTGVIAWTTAFWLPVVVVALRAGVKAVINSFVPVRLGGTKGV